MMQSAKLAARATLLVFFSPSLGLAQAFGIEMGSKASELAIVEDIGDFHYVVEPPRPVSGFESYVVIATPETGACLVRGIGEDFLRDGYGMDVRDKFDELRSLLDENYGQGELLSGLRQGALWDEADEWVMAIRQNERYHQAEWDVNDEDGIDDIILGVEATSSDSSWLALQYRFSNMDDCDAEAKAEDAGGL